MGMGMDNQLRLNACMLAPAPPQPDSPKVGEDYVLNGQSWLLMDYTYGLDHRYSCCDLIEVFRAHDEAWFLVRLRLLDIGLMLYKVPPRSLH